MAQTVSVVLNTAEREQLAAIVADRNRPRKHVERGRVAASADRGSAQRVAQRVSVSRPTVWRWQHRFARSGGRGVSDVAGATTTQSCPPPGSNRCRS
jgi:hypothetical protein